MKWTCIFLPSAGYEDAQLCCVSQSWVSILCVHVGVCLCGIGVWTYSSPPRPRFLLRGGWELGYSPVSLEPHWDCECSLFHCCAVVYKCSNKGYNLEAAVFTLIIKIQMSILFSSTLFSFKINVKYISCIWPGWPGTMEPMGKVPENGRKRQENQCVTSREYSQNKPHSSPIGQ